MNQKEEGGRSKKSCWLRTKKNFDMRNMQK